MKTNAEKIRYYENQSGNWLATANFLKEKTGGKETPEIADMYRKAERFLQLANRRREDGK